MISGIGVDLVAVERFRSWVAFPHARLAKVFTAHEIEYALHEPELGAARLAARFAAKEAFFKALCSALGMMPCSVSRVFLLVEVAQELHKAPILRVDYEGLSTLTASCVIPCFSVHLSLTHEGGVAAAFVILE